MGFKPQARQRQTSILSDIEEDFAVSFREEFINFMSAFPNGIAPTDGVLTLRTWPGVVESCAPMSEDQLKQDDEWHGFQDICELLGPVQMRERYHDKREKNGDCHFWNVRLLRHAYVIGTTYSGDPIVQVTCGKHAGRVLHTNHESYYGGFECLAGGGDEDEIDEMLEAIEDMGVASFDALTTDQVVDILLNENLDGAWSLGSSFEDFYRKLCSYRGTA